MHFIPRSPFLFLSFVNTGGTALEHWPIGVDRVARPDRDRDSRFFRSWEGQRGCLCDDPRDGFCLRVYLRPIDCLRNLRLTDVRDVAD